jgi:archaellum biogenesis protein FlaJ (TadC family)
MCALRRIQVYLIQREIYKMLLVTVFFSQMRVPNTRWLTLSSELTAAMCLPPLTLAVILRTNEMKVNKHDRLFGAGVANAD